MSGCGCVGVSCCGCHCSLWSCSTACVMLGRSSCAVVRNVVGILCWLSSCSYWLMMLWVLMLWSLFCGSGEAAWSLATGWKSSFLRISMTSVR